MFYAGAWHKKPYCEFSGITMEFKNGPVKFNWISWKELKSLKGGLFSVIGVTDAGERYVLGSKVRAGKKVKKNPLVTPRKFRYIQVGANQGEGSNCIQLPPTESYRLTIKNLKFSVTA